jgi:hypothetical protein
VATADLREPALIQLLGFDAVSDGEGFIELAAPLAPDRFAGVMWNNGTLQTTVWRLERRCGDRDLRSRLRPASRPFCHRSA